MKRIAALSLSVLLLFSLVACSNSEQKSSVSSDSQPQISQTEQEENNMQSSQQSTGSEETVGGKTLIAYFSLIDIVPEGADASAHATPSIGNTESAAMEIQRQVGGDLFAIKTVQTYPVSHREASAIAEEEMRSDARPELSTHLDNMDEYDIVYIGYPIWWYIEPMAIRTFLEEYDFTGKTIIPFCTTLGAGVDESVENIASLADGATVLDGITLRTGREDHSEDISEWLSDIGMK